MSNLPQPAQPWRFPRVHLQGEAPTVLRCSNGRCLGANLQVLSLSGGLLSLAQPLVQGSLVKLMFLTGAGSVLGGVEMLPPVTGSLQPFRFVSLGAEEHRRIGTLIWQRSEQDNSELAWVEKLRAASAKCNQPKRWRSKLAGALGLFMIGLAAAAYLLHFGVPR